MANEKIFSKNKEVKGRFIEENGQVLFKPDPKGKFTLIHIDDTLREIPQSPLFFVDHPQCRQKE